MVGWNNLTLAKKEYAHYSIGVHPWHCDEKNDLFINIMQPKMLVYECFESRYPLIYKTLNIFFSFCVIQIHLQVLIKVLLWRCQLKGLQLLVFKVIKLCKINWLFCIGWWNKFKLIKLDSKNIIWFYVILFCYY